MEVDVVTADPIDVVVAAVVVDVACVDVVVLDSVDPASLVALSEPESPQPINATMNSTGMTRWRTLRAVGRNAAPEPAFAFEARATSLLRFITDSPRRVEAVRS